MMIQIEQLDHLVLTVKNIGVTCDFYATVLGMEVITFGPNRRALRFGMHQINLHEVGKEFEPKAMHPMPGSADLCLLTSVPIADVVAHLQHCGVPIIAGPVARTGAAGNLISVYFRDPDRNLLEVAHRV